MAGLSISYLGDQFTIIALLWFVLQLTGSGAAVGFIILCVDLSGVVTGAILGRLLDRHQPRLVMSFDTSPERQSSRRFPHFTPWDRCSSGNICVLALLAGALSPATTAGLRAFVPHP